MISSVLLVFVRSTCAWTCNDWSLERQRHLQAGRSSGWSRIQTGCVAVCGPRHCTCRSPLTGTRITCVVYPKLDRMPGHLALLLLGLLLAPCTDPAERGPRLSRDRPSKAGVRGPGDVWLWTPRRGSTTRRRGAQRVGAGGGRGQFWRHPACGLPGLTGRLAAALRKASSATGPGTFCGTREPVLAGVGSQSVGYWLFRPLPAEVNGQTNYKRCAPIFHKQDRRGGRLCRHRSAIGKTQSMRLPAIQHQAPGIPKPRDVRATAATCLIALLRSRTSGKLAPQSSMESDLGCCGTTCSNQCRQSGFRCPQSRGYSYSGYSLLVL